ncbi:MAG: GMC family oxidoreductase N-terminal domain-containing protein [Candidatus Aminicenantes bacterium]|nr:GMC family oxidoreductase N-terminal domain-containing protein [Candidatus Aminicenantes bacterium]
MRTAVVVGSGAGGAAVAKELQGSFEVLVLEAGREFRPLTVNLGLPERFKRLGLLFDEREIQLFSPAMKIQKTAAGMVLVRGIGTGGTTTLATGNALRMDQSLRVIGLDLDAEFEELEREVPVSTAHQNGWRETTRKLFSLCQDMGLEPRPMPKMGRHESCRNCGRCVLGCPWGVKWDSREFLRMALDNGARLTTGCRVQRVLVQNGRATGVETKAGGRRKFFPADVVVLAAGGLGTPMILQNTGLACRPGLFVDPVLCVAAPWKDALQNREISMPFAVQKEGYILAPYFDYLSYYFNRDWRPAARDTLSLMIKLADASSGFIRGNQVHKVLTVEDVETLRKAVDLCVGILRRLGVDKNEIFFGTMNAGHPGGMLPLTREEAGSLHPSGLPENLYIADPTLFPQSLGNPPILTIMALAKRVGKVIRKALAGN